MNYKIKTINIKLSNRLASYLENVKTKYYLEDWFLINEWWVDLKNYKNLWLIKTLTFEEAIEFILSSLTNEDSLQLWNKYFCVFIKWNLVLNLSNLSLLQAIEKTLTYLLDNNLLWLNKKC